MTSAPKTLKPSHHLFTVKKLMNEMKIRHLPVVESGKIYGVISDRDVALAERVFSSRSDRSVEIQELLLAEPVALQEEQTVAEALKIMLDKRISSVLIQKGKELTGIFTMVDAGKLLLENLEK